MAESAEIKKLIKLRKQRPAFSRMISWEISQSAEHQPVKKLKQKKKKVSASSPDEADKTKEGEDKNKGDSDADSDESSEYETACEDEDEIVDKTEDLSVTDAESQYESIGTDMLDFVSELDIDDDDDDELDEEDDLFMSSVGSDPVPIQSSGEVQQGRRRRLSKKQKRKRKKYFKVTYIDDLYNLGNLFDATDDINDVFTEVLASGPDVEVRRKVPTLVELCMKVNRRKQRSNSEKGKNTGSAEVDKSASLVIPYGMKKLLSSWGRTQKQLENQLSFFLNKILPRVEEKMKSKFHICDEIRTEQEPKLSQPKRSVWTVIPFPPLKSMIEDVQYGCEKTPTFLFTPSMHYHSCEVQNAQYRYSDYYIFANVCLSDAMWALATTIDLMLPSQTHAVSATTAIVRVKRALNLRYKHLVDILFEKVLPYVMWARGKVAIATDMFRNLLEKETETDAKAMYLSEIARMHAVFGDSKTAEQFYRLATETAVEDLHGERRDRCINEATEQKQILLASIYDIGLLDREKAIQSYSYWTGVKNLPAVRTSTMIAGLDALLCYHLSHCTVTGSKLYDEAISKLEKMTKECKYAYYYQSLLHALQGSVDISTRLYRECRSCSSLTPGDAILSLLGRKIRNPWQPLIDLVNTQTLKVKPLEVIWRTNLQPPRVTKHRPMESQMNSLRLNLRLNEVGHLTGDMQMMLPPMRDVSLDPYTGSLMIDNIPSHTGMWTSAYLPRVNFHSLDLLVPTPMLIYSGEDGTTVHMVKPSNTISSLSNLPYYYSKWPPCSFMLYWTGPHGHVAKLNLHTVLKNEAKKKLKEVLEGKQNYFVTQLNYTEEEYKMLFQFLDIAHEKNYSLTEQLLTHAISTRRSDIKRAEKRKQKKENVKAKQPKRSLAYYLQTSSFTSFAFWEIKRDPFVYGKTIVLQVQLTGGSEDIVFVNTGDKYSFLSCNIPPIKTSVWVRQGRDNYTDEEYFMAVTNGILWVLNNIGETVLSVPAADVVAAVRDERPPVIIYPKIFGVNREQNSIWCAVIGFEDLVVDIEDKICWTIGSVYDELTQGTSKQPAIDELTYVGKNNKSTGKLLMANLTTGLAFIDPNSMEFVTIKVKEGCARHFEFTTGNNVIKGEFESLEILAEKGFTVDNEEVYRVVFGVQNKMFVLDMTRKQGDETTDIEMICSVELPGLVNEVSLVGKQVGMLVSLTQHRQEEDEYYREHVFYFDFDGILHSVLLCLGHGPRSFLPVYLHGNRESEGQGEITDQAGWHVYLRDGRDGIMCIRLH